MTPPVSRRRALLLLLMLALLAVLYVQIRRARQSWTLQHEPLPERSEPPRLMLGAAAAIDGPIVISRHDPLDLDGLTRDAVLDLRRQRVARHPDLIREYQPSPAVYSRIVDGLPWWGMLGHFVHGPGQRSIDGTSEESRFLLNPFLLVGIDLFGASIWNQDFAWDPAELAAVPLEEAALPLWVEPASLTWWPAESRAEVVYDVTTFLDRVAELAATPPTLPLGGTSLMPQNARDLGFDFLHVDLDASTHIAQPGHSSEPIRIRSFIHQGGSCGYPGGCNNGSPYQVQLDHIVLEELPARMVIQLWRTRPAGPAAASDMEFVIGLE